MNSKSPSFQSPRDIIKTNDGVLAYYFSAQIANRIVGFVYKHHPSVGPNPFTMSSLVFGFVAAVFFAQGTYTALVWGVIILHLSFIFDCCDGQLARLKGIKSQGGAWFDSHVDRLKDGALLAGFAYGAFVQSSHTNWWIFLVAFAAIYFQFLRGMSALNRELFELKHQPSTKPKTNAFEKSNSALEQFKKTLKHSSLFRVADRVLLYTLFALLNMPTAGIIIYALLELLFSSASAFINYRTFYRFDKKQHS